MKEDNNEGFEEWYYSYWKKYPDEINENTYRHQRNIWNHLTEKHNKEIKELEEDLKNRVAQVHWKCIEIQTLEAQLKVLTRCECGELYTDKQMRRFFICQGCKNKKLIEGGNDD